MRALLLLAALALVPTAAALDALPDARLGATEARVLVRLPDGGALRVDAGPGARAAIVAPGGSPAELVPVPTTFAVPREPPERAWHGLPGTVEVVVHRVSARDAMEILVSDDGGGAAFEWAAEARRLPGAEVWAVFGIVATTLSLMGRNRAR